MDRDASVCGEMERTGVRGLCEIDSDEIKERTSLCDWSVMSIDSVEVIQPLQARQSFKLISAFFNAFLPGVSLDEDGPAMAVE